MTTLKQNTKVSVIIGAQWGDEGKGKLVDILSQNATIVCRCQGGSNAGHTVELAGNKYFFNLIPCGLLNPHTLCVIGNGVVINLTDLCKEMDACLAQGLTHIQRNLRISNRAHIVFDIHKNVDALQESARNSTIGTTKKGIGPTYSSKVTRNGLRIGDLVGPDWSWFCRRYANLVQYLAARYPHSLNVSDAAIAQQLEDLKRQRARIRNMVCDTSLLLHRALTAPSAGKEETKEKEQQQERHILIEGAQSSMLDIDFGTYPFVTSSNCSVGGACTGLGMPPTAIKDVYGVFKAYITRVGDGRMPTEQSDSEVGRKLQSRGGEFGVVTGRARRCGWFDLVVARYVTRINAFTALCLTKLDVLDEFEEVKIGVRYRCERRVRPADTEGAEPGDGIEEAAATDDEQDEFPLDLDRLEELHVEYETLPGWQESTQQCRSAQELPRHALNYVRRIEQLVGVPIKWVGVGPDRNSMIQMF